MKLTLTDEQVSELVKDEVTKKVTEVKNSYNKELNKVHSQLTQSLSLINFLLSEQDVVVDVVTKIKLTDDLFISLWKAGKSNASIAKECGYNPGYISQMKKKLLEKGLITERSSTITTETMTTLPPK